MVLLHICSAGAYVTIFSNVTKILQIFYCHLNPPPQSGRVRFLNIPVSLWQCGIDILGALKEMV